MLEAAGGGGGTPWESMTIEKMQSLIQNPNTDAQWDLGDGWKKSAELLLEHRFQVQDYRNNLAAAWPPEKSAASAAYLGRLDELVKNLSDTYEASLANHEAISAATGSIYQAQVQMEKIYQEYKNNETALNAYNTKVQEQQNSATPTPSPSPSGEEPPVAPGRQEELRLQAVKMLSGVSSELAQAQVRIVKPAPYQQFKESGTSDPGPDDNPYSPPPIPPITPSFADVSTSSTSSTHKATTFPTSTPTTVAPSVTAPSVGTQQPGLVLGGTTQPVLPPPSTGISSVNPTFPGGTGGTLTPGLVPPSTGFLPGGGSTPLGTGVGRGIGASREGLLRPGGRISQPGMRAMAPGGVIGGAPMGIGQPGAGRAGQSAAGTRRINPVGGVIGEGEGALGSRRGVSAGGASAAGHPNGMYGQGVGRQSSRREDADSSYWDPDNPWETAEGVDPVVLPAREQHIDPGPAIGLG